MSRGKKIHRFMTATLVGILCLTSFVLPAYAQEREFVFVGAWPYSLPPKGHFNTYVTYSIQLGAYFHLIQEPFTFYLWFNDTYVPRLATSWEIEGDEFIVNLRQGVSWQNGDPFTSRDVISTFYCLFLLKSPVWEYIDEVTAVDLNTVSFHISKASIVMVRYILREPIRPYASYGEFSDQAISLLDEGKTWDSEEIQDLITDFRNYRPEEYVGTGPYMWTGEITESEVWLKKNPNHWAADEIKFEWIKLYNGETPTVTPLVLGFKVDYATHGFPPATEMEYYRIGVSVFRPPVHSGPAILFNHELYPFDQPEFRRAIDHAINKSENAYVSLMYSAKAIEVPTGLPLELDPLWITPETEAELTDYSYDLDKATALLEGLGFTKGADGWWRDGDGEVLEYELIFPAEFADWRAGAENAAAQLTAFGINVILRAITFTEVEPKFVKEGQFEMAVQGWGAGNPYPHFSYYQDFAYFNFPGEPQPGYSYALQREIEDLGAVDIEQWVVDCAEGFDVEAQKELVNQLALAFNRDLPSVPLWERYGNNAVLQGVRVVGWPSAEHWIWKNSLYADNPVAIMLGTGKFLTPVGWTPPTPAPVVEIPEELTEAVETLEILVTDMQSDVTTLTNSLTSVETTATNLEEEVTALSGAIGSATTTGYGAIGLAVISLVVAIIAITRRPE